MTASNVVENSPLSPDPKYARLPTEPQVEAAVARLRARGIEVVVVETLDDLRREVLARIPAGSDVFDGASQTLEQSGVVRALSETPGITRMKTRLFAMDRKTQAREICRISQAPDVALGSVHAITEDGVVLVASATGNQLGPYSYGAARVIWVAGIQKIVPTLEDGFDRIEKYSFPLEDARARVAYKSPSVISQTLVVRYEYRPGRTTMILVRQNVGF